MCSTIRWEEIASITGASEAAVKSTIEQGRVRLRELAKEPADTSLPVLPDVMRDGSVNM